MAKATTGQRQRGQTKKTGLQSTEHNELMNPKGPLEMLMDMFGLVMPMEQPATGTTVAEKGPPAAQPRVGQQNAPANTFGFDEQGLLTSSPPAFQPMQPATVNAAAEQMSQAGDMAQQVQAWDPFKGMVPFIGRGPGVLPSQGGDPNEAAIEAAQNVPAPGPKAPLGVPAPNMPMPARNNVSMPAPEMNPAFHTLPPPSRDPAADAVEQQLIQQGGADVNGNYGQFGYGTQPYPMGQPEADALARFFRMMAQGGI